MQITTYKESELNKAESIEEIICLAVLIAKGKLKHNQTITDMVEYYATIKDDCSNCKYNNDCLACIINE
jgi:hypothetical protein